MNVLHTGACKISMFVHLVIFTVVIHSGLAMKKRNYRIYAVAGHSAYCEPLVPGGEVIW